LPLVVSLPPKPAAQMLQRGSYRLLRGTAFVIIP
jgi:hypothetical protein